MKPCNIDAKGKALRLVMGILCALAGVAVAVLAWLAIWPGAWAWGLAGVLAVSGGVMIYEGAAGWCFLRALGVRTPV